MYIMITGTLINEIPQFNFALNLVMICVTKVEDEGFIKLLTYLRLSNIEFYRLNLAIDYTQIILDSEDRRRQFCIQVLQGILQY